MNIGIGDLLALLFVGLKLAGQIDWSWWWVTSPWWIVFSLSLVAEIAKRDKPLR